MFHHRMQGGVERACLLTLVLALSLPSERQSSCNAVSSHIVTSRNHYDSSGLASHVLTSLNDGHYASEDTLQPRPLHNALISAFGNIAQLVSKLENDYKGEEEMGPLTEQILQWKASPNYVLERRAESWEEEDSPDDVTDLRDTIAKHIPPGISLIKRNTNMNPFLRYRLRRYRAFHGNNKLSNIWTPRFQSSTFLFGEDDRSVVDPSAVRNYPYNNVVRLSTGCTGTLVSPRHVLTAAHCIHKGKESKVIGGVKIEVPGVMGSRIYFGVKAMIPLAFTTGYSGAQRAMNDFAVLELSSSVPGHWHFLQPDWQIDPLDHVIKFYAYPADHYPDLWSSTCFIDGRTGSLLLNRCDASSGTSGATALMRVKSHGLRIIGIVSAVIENRHPGKHFNAITRLTLNKLHVICRMISYPYNQYFCSDLPPSNIDARSRYIEEYFL